MVPELDVVLLHGDVRAGPLTKISGRNSVFCSRKELPLGFCKFYKHKKAVEHNKCKNPKSIIWPPAPVPYVAYLLSVILISREALYEIFS